MIVLRKKLLIFATIAMAVIVSICFGLSAVSASIASPSSRFTIVLDAGHGGIDPGGVGSFTKVKESEINLQIVQKLEKLFADAGFRVVLTRKNSGGLYGLPTSGYKRRDMEKRKEIIEQAKPNVVLSVHQNNFLADRTRCGGQVFFRVDNAESHALANSIQKELNGLGKNNYAALQGDYYILNCSTYPAVIVECGFLSNAEEEKLLQTEEYQNSIAYAIFCGVLTFFS